MFCVRAEKWRSGLLGVVLAAVAPAGAWGQYLGPAAGTSVATAETQPALRPTPLDPQKVRDQDDMTWDDYKPIPGINWADPDRLPTGRQFHIALVVADFDDQPFVVTLPKGSDLFKNPQIDAVEREKVPQFYADFWNKPQPAVNHGHTLNEYWMEQSHGRFGITQVVPFGPYRMPKKLWQYGLTEYGQNVFTPDGSRANGRLPEVDALWNADPKRGTDKYDVVLRIFAGYDETCLWQEFGEMKFQTRDDITPEFGNPDPTKARWGPTRYEPWTSWKAAEMPWSNSSIQVGESSGSIRHEISHFAFRVGDNNNNPFAQPYRRAGAGPWDIMDRGSFNGPGGVHNRWQVPVTFGGAMPAGLMLRQRINYGFTTPEQVLTLSRDGLAQSGLAVATVVAREVEPGPGQLTGIVVRLDGAAPGESPDRTPPSDPAVDPLSPGNPLYTFYSMEVVQRIGYDSYCPDSGVLLAKNKDRESQTGGPNGFNCFNWVIDAHPEDIHMLDFKRPNGEAVMRTIADYRQLNDALFHAGLDSGSQYEWEDVPNRLHFYVIDVQRDAAGVLSYTLGVRSLDGAGPQQRGVAVAAPAALSPNQAQPECDFMLTNTGTEAMPAAGEAATQPQAGAYLGSDIYRLAVTVEGKGWSGRLLNGLAAVKAGASQRLPVYLSREAGAAATATVTLKATSESDPTKTMAASYVVR